MLKLNLLKTSIIIGGVLMKYTISKGSMDKADGIYFQNMTGKEIEQRLKENDIIIIPVGSKEYHGKGQC